MKTTLLLLSLCLLAAPWAGAADAQKIATVDLAKVYNNFWRTRQAEVVMKEQVASLEKDLKEMIDQLKKGEADYRKLLDSTTDLSLSATEREKRKKESENALLDLRNLESRIKQFRDSAEARLSEEQRRKSDAILEAIRDVIKASVKTGGYTLVLDSAATSSRGAPIVLFNAGTDDLTTNVLAQLNLSAPAAPEKGEPKPADKPAK